MRISDLRGIARLAAQATTGVVRLVEGVHASVERSVGLARAADPAATTGLTGAVYRTIRGVARGVGTGTDALLALLERPSDAPDTASPARDAMLAALNGVLGDHLAASGNPLALAMSLHHGGAPVTADVPDAKRKLLVLVHGLCLHDGHWKTERDGRVVDHGDAIAGALGYTPIHVRYNTGRHVSENGRELSARLESLVSGSPVPVDEIAILAHSMGGLVARSACHAAEHARAAQWRSRLRHLVFLGTPHHGAPLERAGNELDRLLAATPWTAPFARLGQARSAGITDLRNGQLLDEDWSGSDRFARERTAPAHVALPSGVACFAIGATLASRRSLLADRLVGDGLVPLRSALGRHDDAHRSLAFAPASQWIAYRTGHIELLRSVEVGEQIVRWLGSTRAIAAAP